MFQTIDGFLKAWAYETKQTERLLDVLTDESLHQEITSEHWNLGRLAWHMVTAIHSIMSQTGLIFDAPVEGSPPPHTAKKIAESYRNTNEAFIKALKETWTDDTLKEISDLFGQHCPNHFFLTVLIRHQIHHRGQATVLMRQAGLIVPGIYGPSKEEWATITTTRSKN